MRTAIPTLALLTLIGCSQDSTDPTVSAASKSVWSEAGVKIAALRADRDAKIQEAEKAVKAKGEEVKHSKEWDRVFKQATSEFETEASAIINQLPALTINNESPDVLEIVKVGKANEVTIYRTFTIPVTVVLKRDVAPNSRFDVTSYSADDRVLGTITWSAPTGKAGEKHKASLSVQWNYTKPTISALSSVTVRQIPPANSKK